MGLRLIIEDVEGATTIVPLGQDAVTIGRKEGNTIRLTEQNVSRSHAKLFPTDEGWKLEDLESYNGITVNGVAIEGRVELNEGDLIKIGDYHLVLSDDVERKTVDLGPVRAANDGEQPILASSSADLPALSASELLALQGTETGARAAAVGMTPAAAPVMPVPAHSYGDEEEERKVGAGLWVGIGLVAIALVGGGIWFATQGGKNPGAAATGQSDSGTEPAGDSAADGTAPEPAANDAGVPAADAGAAETGEDTDGEGETGEGDPGFVAEPMDEDEFNKAVKDQKRKDAAKKKKKEEAAALSQADPDELLSDARKASMAGDAAKAYKLASDAYKISKSKEAAKLMGVSACKMGSVKKAKSAYKKLSGADKKGVAALCEKKDIILE